MSDDAIVSCSCCGRGIRDNAEENCDFNTRGQDQGFGMCRECGGEDPGTWGDASKMTEEEFKKKQGWALTTFYDARMEPFRSRLNAKNQATWDTLPYWKKCYLLENAVKDGLII
jgi:hypothetical protein